MTGRIEQWSLVTGHCYGGFAAPGFRNARVCGGVHGHLSGRPDGTEIVTSAVTKLDFERGTVGTESGSFYVLGEPAPSWVAWLHERGLSLEAYGYVGNPIVTGNGADVSEPDPED